MSINRYPLTFSIIFIFMFAMLICFFKRSSEEQILPQTYQALNFPVLEVRTDGAKIIKSKENYRNGEYTLKDSDGTIIAEDKCKIRGRGNSTWTTIDTNKHSYLLKIKEPKSFFGFAKSDKWILMSNVTDKTSIRNVYAYHIARTIFNRTGWVPQTKFITLVVNGKYMGLYGFMEKADLQEGRIELPETKSFLAEVNPRLNRAWNFISNQFLELSIRKKEGADAQYYQNAQNVILNFENILFSDYFKDEKKGYRAYIDVDSFVDWYLVNEYTKNHDARFQASCFFTWNEKENKFHMGPVWDFDISCGNYSKRDADKPEGLWIQSEAWYARIWEDEWFRAKVAARWNEKVMDVRKSVDWIEEKADFLTDAANLDDKVWLRFGYRQWPNAPGYKERKTFRDEVDYLTDWCKRRIDWLSAEFNAYSR